MATNKTSIAVEARRRAREAKAVLDAEREKRDRQVEEHATAYYVAVRTIEDLRAEIGAAQESADQAIRDLLDLGESAEKVATLTGLSVKEVRRARRGADQGEPSAAAAGDGS